MDASDDFPTASHYEQQNQHAKESADGDAVDFGWGHDRKLTGRRKKVESSKKAKAGSFGECAVQGQSEGTRSPL